MGSVHWGIPESFVDAILAAGSFETAIETGTYRGASAAVLARRFREVITIEGDADLAAAACIRFASNSQVRVLQGDARHLLPGIVEHLEAPALFWLDSHYCGRGTFGAEDQCPVLDEIRSVVQSPIPHVLLIDDARFFLSPPPRLLDTSQWPSIDGICRAIDGGTARRHVVIHDDVIAAIPLDAFRRVEPWLLDRADARFAAGERTLRPRLRRLANRLNRVARRLTGKPSP